MAIEVRFKCSESEKDYITVDSSKKEGVVCLSGVFEGNVLAYSLDVPTAIKLSKTIRTHINKVKEI